MIQICSYIPSMIPLIVQSLALVFLLQFPGILDRSSYVVKRCEVK